MSSKKAICRVGGQWEVLHRTTAAKLGFKDVKPVTDDYCFVLPENAWLETPLNDAWMVAYRLAMQNGSPVVAEVRIFPSEPGKRRAGEWWGQWQGMKADVPAGGLPARLFHQVRPGEVSAQLEEIYSKVRRDYRGGDIDALLAGFAAPAPVKKHTVGRKPRPDIEYARLAAAYVQSLRYSNPVERVAKMKRLTAPQVRGRLNKARKNGFLTTPTKKQGRAGGVLTAKATAILKGGNHA